MSQAQSANAMLYGSRYPSTGQSVAARACPVCGGTPPSSRSVYCKTACKQLAYRLRHQRLATLDPVILRKQLQRQRLLVAHTVYECARCLRFVSSKSTSIGRRGMRSQRGGYRSLDN